MMEMMAAMNMMMPTEDMSMHQFQQQQQQQQQAASQPPPSQLQKQASSRLTPLQVGVLFTI
jgi:hypothetical protein